jgi:aromatic-amino-acid transaminase
MARNNDVILALNQQAQARKAAGFDVTNGSIGMMYRDDGHLPVSAALRGILAKHTADEDLTYPSVAGGSEYQNALRHWFLGDAFEEEVKAGEFASLGTPGGTGAVALSFHVAQKGKTAVLLPSLDWPNYEGIAKGFGDETLYYELFKGDSLNLEAITARIEDGVKTFDSLLLVINDPCQNPTGYALKEEEWEAVVSLLNAQKGKVSLLIDAAYIDFAETAQRQNLIKALKSLSKEVPAYLCFSFSKTLSFYGLRIGALALYQKDQAALQERYHAAVMGARALWSTPNHMAMNAITEILSSPEGFEALKEETKENRAIVAKRAAIFFQEAKAIGLVTYPYTYGFFVTLPVPDAVSLSAKLVKKDIFLAPIQPQALRVALCSVPTPKIYGLAQAIKEAL